MFVGSIDESELRRTLAVFNMNVGNTKLYLQDKHRLCYVVRLISHLWEFLLVIVSFSWADCGEGLCFVIQKRNALLIVTQGFMSCNPRIC
jgi:hypothetical protein